MRHIQHWLASAAHAASRAAAALAVCSLFVTVVAHAQAWAPNESLVSAQKDMIDPEYNQARAQFVWSSADGKLWVGSPGTELEFAL